MATLGVIAAFAAYLATQQSDAANEARARAEIEAETAKQTTSFMTDLFNVADPSEARGDTITAKEVLDKGAARIRQGTCRAAGHSVDAHGDDRLGLHEPWPVSPGDSTAAQLRSKSAAPFMARSTSKSRA